MQHGKDSVQMATMNDTFAIIVQMVFGKKRMLMAARPKSMPTSMNWAKIVIDRMGRIIWEHLKRFVLE